MKKKWMIAALVAVILAAFFWSPFSNYPISLGVMKVYSGLHVRESIMAEKGIELSIPGGGVTEEDDWYPFVMTFNDDAGFQRFTGQSDLKLTILYNFPAFDMRKGCSRLFDSGSPYYNGFYGAYLVCREEGSRETKPYGFLSDGSIDLKATAQVPQFDFQNLVLRDFGIQREQLVFDWKIGRVKENAEYGGISGWTQVDAVLTVNGVFHQRTRFCRSYLQYGSPADSWQGEEFAPIDMVGRVYGRYFEEWDTSVFFYVLAADMAVLESCDEKILSQSVLR
ncbi:MAG: hypothetical protein HFE73_05500 [Firmicutes bacterium]|nr:hypothetical protein [Bacillota bacterium]